MPDILNSIRDSLKTFEEIFKLLIQIGVIIKHHARLFAALVLVVLAYGALAYYAIYYPASCIRAFYRAVEDKHPSDIAWNLLYPPFRDERWSGTNDFENGFKTTVAYSDLSISYAGHAWNPKDVFNAFFADSLEYDVSFKVSDRFTASDLGREESQDDLPWLEIAHRRTYELLQKRQIGNLANPNPSLEITRSYKKMIELKKNPTWQISRMDTYEVSIKPGAD